MNRYISRLTFILVLSGIVLLFVLISRHKSVKNPTKHSQKTAAQQMAALSLEDQLLDAVNQHQDSLVQNLLEQGANPNFKSFNGMSALVLAAGRGNHALVEKLLQHGADPDISTQSGNTALMAAAQAKHASIVILLLEQGANVHVTRPTGETAFHFATHACCMPCILSMLKSGADPHAPNQDGHTPLSVACPETKVLIQVYQQQTQGK